jgi:hypothetical protein
MLAPASRAADDRDTIKREAQKCASALIAGDFDTFVSYNHPRLIQMMGGKDAFAAALKEGLSRMQDSGSAFVSADIGTPEAPKKIGGWLVSIVPEHSVTKVQGGKLIADSSLLGISEDGGHRWYFVDIGKTTPDQFAQVFPELAGKIELPKPKKPVYIESK